MEAAILVGSLRVAYHLLLFGVKLDQAPDAVRRFIELVRTCHYNLEALIKHRDDFLPLLRSKADHFNRVNTIIDRARASLVGVALLVEKLRPNDHDGIMPFGALSPEGPAPVNPGASQTPSVRTPLALTTDPPPPYSPPTSSFANGSWSLPGTAPRPFVYNASVPDVREHGALLTAQAPTAYPRASASASDGMPLLFGDLKASFREGSNTFGSNTIGGNHNPQPVSQPSLTQSWHTGGGQQNQPHPDMLSRMSSLYLDGANLSAPHLPPQPAPQPPTLGPAPAGEGNILVNSGLLADGSPEGECSQAPGKLLSHWVFPSREPALQITISDMAIWSS